MGGPAGSGGSDQSDERKVDTYADQLKKEQKRLSKFKRDKHGNIKKKNIIDEIVDHHPLIQGVKNLADRHNLNRRMKFANKQGINIQGLSTEQILSKDFKSQLDAKGYSVEPGNVGGGNGGRDNNQQRAENSAVQPGVDSQMDNTGVKSNLITADKTSPTTAEMSEDQNMIDIKRRGRKTTMLTSDLNENKKTTLSKKVLLGG